MICCKKKDKMRCREQDERWKGGDTVCERFWEPASHERNDCESHQGNDCRNEKFLNPENHRAEACR